MFQRLQKKWKVNGLQLAVILCTFVIGGSLTGFAGKNLMNFIAVKNSWLWVIIYIIIITFLWPVSVLLVSFFLGQYRFFIRYVRKIGRRVGIGGRRYELGGEVITNNNKQEVPGNEQ